MNRGDNAIEGREAYGGLGDVKRKAGVRSPGDDAARVVMRQRRTECLRGPCKSVDVAGCS